MEVSEAELAARRAALPKPEPRYERGYGWMFSRHIEQAHLGCDFDFLKTGFGAPVKEPVIFLKPARTAVSFPAERSEGKGIQPRRALLEAGSPSQAPRRLAGDDTAGTSPCPSPPPPAPS